MVARVAGVDGARGLTARRGGLRAARVGPARLLQGPAGARALPDAGRRHLLAHLRDAEARASHREYILMRPRAVITHGAARWGLCCDELAKAILLLVTAEHSSEEKV